MAKSKGIEFAFSSFTCYLFSWYCSHACASYTPIHWRILICRIKQIENEQFCDPPEPSTKQYISGASTDAKSVNGGKCTCLASNGEHTEGLTQHDRAVLSLFQSTTFEQSRLQANIQLAIFPFSILRGKCRRPVHFEQLSDILSNILSKQGRSQRIPNYGIAQ